MRDELVWTFAQLKGLRPYAGGYTALCPAHADRNASLSIRESEDGCVLFHCFAGCTYGAIRRALGWRQWRPVQSGLGSSRSANSRYVAEYLRRRQKYALRIWREALPAVGTLVERYLRSRHITIPVPPSLRFHPNLKHPSGAYGAAMVAAVQGVSGQVVAVHRTWLGADGKGKAELTPAKAMLGPIAGGAVRLAAASSNLIVGEGIESTLSVMQATGGHAWASLSTSGLKTVALPATVREILIAADNDPAGRKAAVETASRLARKDRSVRIAYPPPNTDFNDLLSKGFQA